MASLLCASCSICGMKRGGLVFGGGFKRHTPIVPALEITTHQLVSVDQGDTDMYRYYTDPSMYEHHDQIEMIQWGELYLRKKYNYCPQCEDFSMDFEVVGEMD